MLARSSVACLLALSSSGSALAGCDTASSRTDSRNTVVASNGVAGAGPASTASGGLAAGTLVAKEHEIRDVREVTSDHASRAARRRSAFEITDTELSVIAALASMGLSSTPKNGYKSPAATGTPTML